MTGDNPAPSGRYDVAALELHTPPPDVKASERVGYAVYDKVVGQYVTGVTADKPDLEAVTAARGHSELAVVAV